MVASKRDFNNKAGKGKDQTPEAKESKRAELLRVLKKDLPEPGTFSFVLGEEKINATQKQKSVVQMIQNKDIVFVSGPFGTGKTFWAVFAALQGLATGKYKKIAITSPAVESGEKLGFLPGEKDDKMREFVNQLIETFEDFLGSPNRYKAMVDAGLIEIAPHAFMRGRTFKQTIFLSDESQNATGNQLQTALSRLGFHSTLVFMGDEKQNDRTATQSPYVAFRERYTQPKYQEWIGSVAFGPEDSRRHPLLKRIIENGDDRPLEEAAQPITTGNGHAQPRARRNGNGTAPHIAPN